MNRDKILKFVAVVAALIVLVSCLTLVRKRYSMSLAEYASLHPASGTETAAEPPSPSLPEEEEGK